MAAGAATRFAGPGVVFALVALVLFALMAITTDVALETTAWLQVLLVVADRRTRLDRDRRRGRRCWRGRAAVRSGALDRRRRSHRPVAPRDRRGDRRWPACSTSLGLVAFAIGLETAPTWMVGLASSFGPAVTILVAVAFLGERLKPIQWFGLAGIAIGMVAIAAALSGDAASGRQAEPEPRLAVAGLGADPAAARLDQLLDDGQPDPGAAARPVARLLDAVEALEDAIEVVRRDRRRRCSRSRRGGPPAGARPGR